MSKFYFKNVLILNYYYKKMFLLLIYQLFNRVTLLKIVKMYVNN